MNLMSWYKKAKEIDIDTYMAMEIRKKGLGDPLFRHIPLQEIKDWLMKTDPELEIHRQQPIDQLYEDFKRENPNYFNKPQPKIMDLPKLPTRSFLK